MLYFRMLLTMGVSLYTVRVVLNTLGAVDYGINNVVGGVVVMFSFLGNSMASASQRYFAFEIGRNDDIQLKRTFSTTMAIYALIAIIVLILAETLGLWFLNTQMKIPSERMVAANWVYQFSVLSFMMTLLAIPYNASIIAHERMNIYAYVSIAEVILKLIIVYILVLFSYDKLKLYAILIFFVTTIITLLYRSYCKRKFAECRFPFYWDKSLFKELVSYSGWNLFGALAGVCNDQGINIILNVFWGPVVNTARGIAYQVNGAINQFVQNFMTATRPQIIKYYSSGEKEQMLKLVFQSSKLSFFLLLILSMPVLLETQFILTLWLINAPDYVVVFTRLIIIGALIDSISYPLMTTAQATGRIKRYQATVGGVMLLNIPLSYIFLKLSFPPQTVFFVSIINSIVCLFIRLNMLKTMVNFPVSNFFTIVVVPLFLITSLGLFFPFLVLLQMQEGFLRFLIVGIVGLISSISLIYLLGLSKEEKFFIVQIIRKLIKT
jgi:O-antigen/teichoic acid export membrane protein